MNSSLKSNRNRFLSTIHAQDSLGLYTVGLTGHPGSGKSLVLKWLRQLGFATIQCDLVTANLYSDPHIQNQVIKQFGLEIMNSGSLDSNHFKEAIKNYIGLSASRLKEVSQFMQPKILDKITDEFNNLRSLGKNCVIVEVPLIYETNWEKVFNCIIHIMRDQELITVKLARRGWSSDYIALLRSQYKPTDYYVRHADVTLTNYHDKLHLWTQVKTIIKELK